MKWSDIPFQPTNRTLRQFAASWVVAFFAVGLSEYAFKHRPTIGLVLIISAFLVGIPGLLRPRWLRPIFVAWMVAAFPIGWLVSTLALCLLYFGLFTPIGFVLRLLGRDALERRPVQGRDTFWVRKHSPVDARQYLRQY